jgi:excisionase family DNA binding protein
VADHLREILATEEFRARLLLVMREAWQRPPAFLTGQLTAGPSGTGSHAGLPITASSFSIVPGEAIAAGVMTKDLMHHTPPPAPLPNLVDACELARRLAVKVPTIRAWTRLTDIPRTRCGRLVRFDYENVLSWFRARGARKVSATSAMPPKSARKRVRK